MNFVLRLFLVTAGLVLAGSLAAAFALMLVFWGVRAGWARLTGRPVAPFIIRIDPRSGFDRMYRHRGEPGAVRGADGTRQRTGVADVTDVEPRSPAS